MTPRVLIVDDSLTVRMDLGERFAEAGFETVLCASVAEARRALEQRCDLVVLDVVLPDGDGLELLGELRSKGRTELPVVLLSTEAEVADRVRGLETGADAYVGKPYDAAQLLSRARRLLRTESPTLPTILIVDDSATYREDLSRRLENAGYRVAMAVSGEEGLLRAAEVAPSAIIVDGIMPGIDGTAVIRQVRLDPALRATPCLLLTASEGAAGEIVALDAGADAYVRKNEGPEVLLTRLAAVLRSAPASRTGVTGESLLAPKKVLAVDDSSTYLEELAEVLREDGYEVVKATSGESALELLGIERVDCVLLDLMMPGLSGHETCRRIKESPIVRDIPLIMLTALEDPEAMIAGINSGADDFVAKSADTSVLKARLRAQLRRKRFEDENRRVRDEILTIETEVRAQRELAELRSQLLTRLEEKNAELLGKNTELEALNREMETFAYSVSHDLRQPLRSIDGFSRALLEQHQAQLNDEGRRFLGRIRGGAQRMSELIEALLALSRVSRRPLLCRRISIDALARSVFGRICESEPDRAVEVVIAERLEGLGDPQLIESALENLIGNAWKFTSKCERPRIEVGAQHHGTFFVRDNGVGFQMAYADKLFAPFQRLHASTEFAGTGVGLATVQRIIQRHGGRVWAESSPNGGATFFFTLGERGTSE